MRVEQQTVSNRMVAKNRRLFCKKEFVYVLNAHPKARVECVLELFTAALRQAGSRIHGNFF